MPPFRPDPLQARGLKLSHLRLLAALLDSAHIGLAAAGLGISQPAASRLLAEVERITGQPVHQRTGRGLALTEVGLALARRAQRVQMELADAARDLVEAGAGTVGHVRIGSVTGPALDLVLPVLQAARELLPQVTAEVVVAPSDALVEQLLSGRLDFAIGRRPQGPDRGLIAQTRLSPEPVALIARRNHPLDGAGPVRPAALLAHDWVMPPPESILTRAVLDRLARLGLDPPQQRLSTASFLLTLALIRQSDAIAPLAAAVVEAFTRDAAAPYVRLRVRLGIMVEAYGLLTRAGAALPPAAGRLSQMILARARGAAG